MWHLACYVRDIFNQKREGFSGRKLNLNQALDSRPDGELSPTALYFQLGQRQLKALAKPSFNSDVHPVHKTSIGWGNDKMARP
jgi:hypothetical protein